MASPLIVGATSPGTNDSSVGAQPWQALTKLAAQDNDPTYVNLVVADTTSNRLRVAFDVSSLPNAATVTGLRVRIRFAALSVALRTLTELEVQLLIGEALVGTNKAVNAVVGSGAETFATFTHGADGDMWGTADGVLTVAALKAATNLLALRYKTDATGGTNSYPEVDYVDLTVYYTEGAAPRAATQLFRMMEA